MLWLFEALIISYYILKRLNPVITTMIGLLFSVPVSLFWLEYKIPILQIKKETETRYARFPSTRELSVIRIAIENRGRSAAKGCKGYIVTDGSKERIGWMVPAERPNSTINVEDNERLDFCGFLYSPLDDEERSKIYFSTEEGWDSPRITGALNRCKLLVTSENADPVEATIKIDIYQKKIEIE
jgi:hypothetical protein